MVPMADMPSDSEMKSQMNDSDEFIDLNYYRKLVRTHIDLRRYKTALFWAEKVVVLSQYDPKDVYWQAQCMFYLHEYHRAAYIIKLRGFEKTNILCHYLAVESLLEAKEYEEAIELLNSIDIDYLSSSIGMVDDVAQNMLAGLDDEDGEPTKSEVLASICLLKGKVLEAMDNRTLAMESYVQALHLSVHCTEALDALVQHEMLLSSEENELMSHLPFDSQCTTTDTKIISKLYQSKLKKYYETEKTQTTNNLQTPIGNLTTIKSILECTEKTKSDRTSSEFRRSSRDASAKFFTPIQQSILSPANKILQDLKATPSYSLQSSMSRLGTSSIVTTPISGSNSASILQAKSVEPIRQIDISLAKSPLSITVTFERINQSLDLMVAKAEELFYNCEYKKCIRILEDILKADPYHTIALTVLIGCFMELKEYNRLFCIAHKLVDLYSDQAISWYAVGCYYDLIGKSDPARRYLSKATAIDRLFGPAWLAYGHSFAKENEHDQAMAAYFKATQLMRGCHLPLLYIGVECGLTKNLELAEKFFYQAMALAPLDVFVLHEFGVIKFEYEYYTDAEEIFRTTLNMVTKMAQEHNESISNRWEPLLNNLGHCCRKNKKYDEALTFHEQALVLKPQSAPTYTAIGFVHALKGSLETAVEYLHRSLALKRDDTVTTALLKSCLEDLMEENILPDNLTEPKVEGAAAPPAKKNNGGDPSKICMKITFDDDSNNSHCSDTIDNTFDMSMDV